MNPHSGMDRKKVVVTCHDVGRIGFYRAINDHVVTRMVFDS